MQYSLLLNVLLSLGLLLNAAILHPMVGMCVCVCMHSIAHLQRRALLAHDPNSSFGGQCQSRVWLLSIHSVRIQSSDADTHTHSVYMDTPYHH